MKNTISITCRGEIWQNDSLHKISKCYDESYFVLISFDDFVFFSLWMSIAKHNKGLRPGNMGVFDPPDRETNALYDDCSKA